MARVVLFSPTPPDLSAFGVRGLQASLKAAGHETRLVLFPGSIGLSQEDGSYVYRYADTVIDQAMELAAPMISRMAPDRAAVLASIGMIRR